MLDAPELVAQMAGFWREFVARLLDKVFAVITPDRLLITEDMAYKGKAMISPAMTREFCQPCWIDWATRARSAGVPLVEIDSDGYCGELISLWIESGVNVCSPLEVAAGNDILKFRESFGRTIAFRQGVDKRAIARGGETMRAELVRIAPVVENGGFIPGCDHGVPPDITWQNFLDYSKALAQLTGWL
ncbi:MAG: hypothetical protein ACUVWX_01855 [Kiritimatiellia bacterium]